MSSLNEIVHICVLEQAWHKLTKACFELNKVVEYIWKEEEKDLELAQDGYDLSLEELAL